MKNESNDGMTDAREHGGSLTPLQTGRGDPIRMKVTTDALRSNPHDSVAEDPAGRFGKTSKSPSTGTTAVGRNLHDWKIRDWKPWTRVARRKSGRQW